MLIIKAEMAWIPWPGLCNLRVGREGAGTAGPDSPQTMQVLAGAMEGLGVQSGGGWLQEKYQ